MLRLLTVLSCAAALVTPAAAQDDLPKKAQANLLKIVRDLQGEVAKMRGLAFKAPVETKLDAPKEALEAARVAASRGVDAERAAHEARAFAKMGLLEEKADLTAHRAGLVERQGVVRYDPADRTLHLAKRLPTDPLQLQGLLTSIRRELLRALIDQHFDITEMLAAARTADQERAIRALIEGDICLAIAMREFKIDMKNDGPYAETMLKAIRGLPGSLPQYKRMVEVLSKSGRGKMVFSSDFVTPAFSKEQYSRLFAVPPAIGKEFIFENFVGLKFCYTVYRYSRPRSWASIDRLYARLPVSTEQIRDPATYHGPAGWPVATHLPDVSEELGEGYARVATGSLGAMRVAALVEQWGVRAIDRVTDGWRGDAWDLYAKEGAPDALVTYISWDTRNDALEFAVEVAKSFRNKYKDYTPSNVTGRSFAATRGEYGVKIEMDVPKKGSRWRTIMIEDVPSDSIAAVGKRVMSEVKESQIRPKKRK